MLPVSNGAFEPLQRSPLNWSNRLRQASAVCNGLTMINKSTIAGDTLERSLFRAVEASFLVQLHFGHAMSFCYVAILCGLLMCIAYKVCIPCICWQ